MKQIKNYFTTLHVTDKEITDEDIQSLINTLYYDDKIEYVSLGSDASSTSGGIYRIKAGFDIPMPGLEICPCVHCPVRNECSIGGVINPEECEYMTKWLK